MTKKHFYEATISWTGSESGATVDYKSYSRDYSVELDGKQPLAMSADPAFLGDPSRASSDQIESLSAIQSTDKDALSS